MQKADVKKYVDLFTTNNIPYMIYMDNEIMIDTRSNELTLVFDDEEEVLLVIRNSNDMYTQKERPLDFEYFGYESIQCIKGKLSEEEALAQMLTLKNTNKITTEQYNTITQVIKDIAKPYEAKKHIYV